MDYSKLKYYSELCERGIINDSDRGDLNSLINTLEDRRLDYSSRIKTTSDDVQKEELTRILTVIEGELKELLEIKDAFSSGIIIEKDESIVNADLDQDYDSFDKEEAIESNLSEKKANAKEKSKKGIIIATVVIMGVIALAVVYLLHSSSSNNTATSQNNIESTDDKSQTNANTDNVTIIKSGKFVITCGELKESLLQRFRNINPTIRDFTQDETFKKCGYFWCGSNYDANGEETTEAILVKVLPSKGNNSYDDIIQSYAFFSTDEVDLSKYYAEGINLADSTIDRNYVESLLSKEYDELKDIQPNDESIPISFSNFDFNNVKVYFAVDRGVQWCIITDPSMDFEKQFKECINTF